MIRSLLKNFAKAVLASILLFSTILEAADLVLAGGTVYPSPEANPIVDTVVVIHNSRITTIGQRGSLKIPANSETIDCSGKFIVAGFWNSHVHLFTPALLHSGSASAAELSKELDAMINQWGFTTVFDIGSQLANTVNLRRRIDIGEVRGPRILTTGEPLWTGVPVYVRDYLIANRIEIPIVTTPEDAAARVRAEAHQGANGVKLFTGSVQGGGKVANMPVEMVRAAVDEGHRLHLKVFAHPQNSAGLEAAITGGVDILAHTAPDSPTWTPEFVNRLKQARMALIPTLTLFDFEARKLNGSDQEREQWVQGMVGELRAFSQAGGEILFGTDIGYTDHYDTALEFTLMSRAGMSFRQILASLTTNPAHTFGYSSHSGRAERGMDADLAVLADDPVKDVTAFSRILLTVRAGTVIYSAR